MLKYRIATAALLIPLVLYILFFSSVLTFHLATAVLVCLAGWEWPTLMGKSNLFMRLGYMALLMSGMFLSRLFPVNWLLSFACIIWILHLYWVVHYPAKQVLWAKSWVKGFLGIQIILPCWLALNYLRDLPNANALIIILLLLIWGADTGAYFVGKRYGTHKLIPAVSPNKSWQGFFAAIASSFFVAATSIIWLNDIFLSHWLSFTLLALLTTLASVLGDLTESMFKRAQGIKESGTLLPGHGGILDRIDSLTAAGPFYALGILLLGIN